jgi:hypothetical protein
MSNLAIQAFLEQNQLILLGTMVPLIPDPAQHVDGHDSQQTINKCEHAQWSKTQEDHQGEHKNNIECQLSNNSQ